jgi:hypothetical protein
MFTPLNQPPAGYPRRNRCLGITAPSDDIFDLFLYRAMTFGAALVAHRHIAVRLESALTVRCDAG